MRALAKRAAHSLDLGISRVGARASRGYLLCFLFHAFFEDEEQIQRGVIHPQERLTRASLTAFVEHFLESDHRFVSADEIGGGLSPGGRYVHLTFDDGYANNLGAIELLSAYDVPATVFVATSNVAQGKAYWWDVLHRATVADGDGGVSQDELDALSAQSPVEIEAHVERELGAQASEPLGDLDRPLTEAELTDLSRHPLVTIGNHTMDHANLLQAEPDEVERQLAGAQRYLERLTGTTPRFVSFPYGRFDEQTIATARREGLTMAASVQPRRNRPAMEPDDLMRLGRFSVTCGEGLLHDLRICRSPIRLQHAARLALRRAY